MLCFLFSELLPYTFFPETIAQIFKPTAELVIPIGISSKEAKPEIEIHAVIAEAKIRKRLL